MPKEFHDDAYKTRTLLVRTRLRNREPATDPATKQKKSYPYVLILRLNCYRITFRQKRCRLYRFQTV